MTMPPSAPSSGKTQSTTLRYTISRMIATITSAVSSSVFWPVLPVSAVTAAEPVTDTRSPSPVSAVDRADRVRTAWTAAVSTVVSLSAGAVTVAVKTTACSSGERSAAPGRAEAAYPTGESPDGGPSVGDRREVGGREATVAGEDDGDDVAPGLAR